MKISVLGSTGFIGRNLLSALSRDGYNVVGTSRSSGLDLTDFGSVEKYFKNIVPDVVINCAAHVGSVHYGLKYPADILHDNMTMTLNIYRVLSRSCPKTTLINPISNCSYPMDSLVQIEGEWWKGQPHPSALAYAATRRMTYVAAESYKQQFGVVSKNFIFPGVYGPGDHTDPNRVHALDGMVIRLLFAKRNNQPEFEIWGTGKPVREWCYIDDIVRLLIKSISLDKDLTYPVNLGQNKGYSIRESAEMIAEAVGYKGKLVFNTKYADVAAIKVLDQHRFNDVFPSFIFCDIATGIKKTVEYYDSVLK